MDNEEREHLIRKLKRTKRKMVGENAKETAIKKIKKAIRRLKEVDDGG